MNEALFMSCYLSNPYKHVQVRCFLSCPRLLLICNIHDTCMHRKWLCWFIINNSHYSVSSSTTYGQCTSKECVHVVSMTCNHLLHMLTCVVLYCIIFRGANHFLK